MAMTRPPAASANDDLARAMDPRVRGGELVQLAAHPELAVRVAVAQRADAPMATLISLAHERDARIHDALVDNPGSPAFVLEAMAVSRIARVRQRAADRLALLAPS